MARLRDPDQGYIRAGLPRFPALFGRDACVTSWQLMDFDPAIGWRTLELLAQFQGARQRIFHEEEPGKILHLWHWHPKSLTAELLPWPTPYYGSIDATPLFVYLSWLYFEKTGDKALLNKLWPRIAAALAWCEIYGDANNDLFLEYRRKTILGLRHQGWKDGWLDHLRLLEPVALVEVQGYYYAALKAASELAVARDDKTLSRALALRADKVQAACLEKFWLPRERFFGLALTETNVARPRITSNPGHLLFTGILDNDRAKAAAIVTRLFQPDMWTAFGIRTHAATNPDFNAMSYHLGSIWPHDNWIIAQGLKRLGYIKEYVMVKQALLNAYETLGKIPELYAAVDGKIKEIPDACSPQAWASGALLNFLTTKP